MSPALLAEIAQLQAQIAGRMANGSITLNFHEGRFVGYEVREVVRNVPPAHLGARKPAWMVDKAQP